MKISKNQDFSKSIEIKVEDDGNSSVNLQGSATFRVDNSVSGLQSDVAVFRETGEVDFNHRPSVGGSDVALISDINQDLSSKEQTIVDSSSYTYPICPIQELVTVLYSLQNSGANEKGVITISEVSNGNYEVSVQQHAQEGYFADVEFSASESNGSLLLNVIGTGSGLVTELKYRVNTIQTLYI